MRGDAEWLATDEAHAAQGRAKPWAYTNPRRITWNQRHAFATAVQVDCTTIPQLAAACDLGSSTLYRWSQLEHFQDYWQRSWSEWLREAIRQRRGRVELRGLSACGPVFWTFLSRRSLFDALPQRAAAVGLATLQEVLQ